MLWTVQHSLSRLSDQFLPKGKKIFAGFEGVKNYELFQKLDFPQNDPADT